MKSQSEATFEEPYFRDVYADDYDRRNPQYKHRSYLREIRRVAPDGGRLLEIGCAYGSFLTQAVGHYEVHGCDISAHATSIAMTRVPSAHVFQSDIFGVRSTRTYDVIVCFDVLEHIPDVDRALSHLHDLLKPGGALVATMPVYDTVVGRLVEFLDRDPTHVHKDSRYEWLERIAAARFQQITWKGILRYYFGGPFYLHWSARVIRPFSPAILVSGLAS